MYYLHSISFPSNLYNLYQATNFYHTHYTTIIDGYIKTPTRIIINTIWNQQWLERAGIKHLFKEKINKDGVEITFGFYKSKLK
jgi:hypothetical protein